MNGLLNDPLIQILVVSITTIGTVWAAKLVRIGSREANQVTSWTNLVASLQKTNADLQKRQDDLDSHVGILDASNRELTRRIQLLERSRRAWKTWGQRVVALMDDRGIKLPETPESLEDTDPNIQRII